MKLDKGRPKPEIEEPIEETLESRLARLYEMKLEYRRNQKAFKDANKHLLESIKSQENIVIDEVMKLARTVKIDGIKAEYKPQVVIKMKKDKKDGDL